MNFRAALILLVLNAAHAAFGADYNAIFENAVEAVEFDFEERWAYTETSVDREHVWVGRSDPREPGGERWQLLSVDGRAPSPEELQEYKKEKAHDHSSSGDKRVNAMVEPESVVLVEETDDYWLLRFAPGDDQEAFMGHVDATMRINKTLGHLEYIDLRSHSTIRPAIGVKISKLITRLTFGPAVEGGPVVPLSTQVEVKGRAYFLVSFDEEELIHNTEFEFVSDGETDADKIVNK